MLFYKEQKPNKMKRILFLFVLFQTSVFSQELSVDYLQSVLGNQYTIQKNREGYEIVKQKYINVDEFLKYQQDVRDSIALERLFFNTQDDEYALRYIEIDIQRNKTHGLV